METATKEERLVPALSEAPQLLMLRPVMDVGTALTRLKEFQQFVRAYMVEDEDYGKMPGTTSEKKVLFKPGADKLCEIYGMTDKYEMTLRNELWETKPPLFDYEFKCTLVSRIDGSVIAEGFGSCNSWEGKYRWRDAQRVCPVCGKAAIIKGSEQYGGGWLCWKKRSGCGEKFGEKDQAIIGQEQGRVENEDVATIKNTILKMAKKRAKIDAVIAATRSSGIFTQDVVEEDDKDGKDKGKGDTVDATVVEPNPADLEMASAEMWAKILAAGGPNGWLTFGVYKYAANKWGYPKETVREHVNVAQARELFAYVSENKAEN